MSREWSPLTTDVVGTSAAGSSSRQGTVIDAFIIHETAGGTHDGNLERFHDGTIVTCNYYLSRGIFGIVPETRRAHTTGAPNDGGRGAAWDRRALTVEVRSWQDSAGRWQIDDDDRANLVALLAECAAHHGIPLDAEHVVGHRQLYERHRAGYPTECPASLTDDEITGIIRDAANMEGHDEMTPEQAAMLRKIASKVDKMNWLFNKSFAPALARIDLMRWRFMNRDAPRLEAIAEQLDEIAARLDRLERPDAGA